MPNELPLPHLTGTHAARAWRPPTDVFECDQAYVIRAAISGLKKDEKGELQDTEVLVEKDSVVIRGSRSERCPHTKRVFYQMEIHYGPFECRVRISAPFDRDGIRAEYRDGFLEVIVPKAAPPEPGARHIEVNG